MTRQRTPCPLTVTDRFAFAVLLFPLLFVCHYIRWESIGDFYLRDRLVWVLPCAWFLTVGGKWLFFRAWLRPGHPIRFFLVVALVNGTGSALIAWAECDTYFGLLAIAVLALIEFYLYCPLSRWMGADALFGRANRDRARWAVAVGNLFVAIAVHVFVLKMAYVSCPRHVVSRAKADMRSLQNDLESYIVDHGVPPASLSALTSRVANCHDFLTDPFAPGPERQTYQYTFTIGNTPGMGQT